jgi:hypothetical protein
MSRVVVRNLVDPSYTCIIITTTRSLLSFLFRGHQGEIAADACVPGSTRPDEGQASSWRPHTPQLPPPRPHPCGYLSTVDKKLPALDRRKRMEWASIGSDATDTHSLSVSYTTPHCHCLTMHARFLFCFSGKHRSTSTSRNEEDAFPWLTISNNRLRFGSEQRVWCHVKTICSDLTFFVLEANRECSVKQPQTTTNTKVIRLTVTGPTRKFHPNEETKEHIRICPP